MDRDIRYADFEGARVAYRTRGTGPGAIVFVHGFRSAAGASPGWPEDYEQFVREIAPNVDYRVWDGASHFLMWELADRFNALLDEFVDRIETARASSGGANLISPLDGAP